MKDKRYKISSGALAEIKELYGRFKLGEGAYKRIGKIYKISSHMIRFHLDPKYRQSNYEASKKWREKNPEKVKRTNIKAVRKYQKHHREELNKRHLEYYYKMKKDPKRYKKYLQKQKEYMRRYRKNHE